MRDKGRIKDVNVQDNELYYRWKHCYERVTY
jgi:hypothetical protein